MPKKTLRIKPAKPSGTKLVRKSQIFLQTPGSKFHKAMKKITPKERKLNVKALDAVSKLEDLIEGTKDSPLFQWMLSQMQYNIQQHVKLTAKK